MDAKTKQMIQGWIVMHRGDVEGLAVWMRSALHIGIRDARKFIAQAQS